MREKFEKQKIDFEKLLNQLGVTSIPALEVAYNMDVSGSFDDEHKDGLTQLFVNASALPCMVFDPDQKLDMFTFSHGEGNAVHVGEITAENYPTYMKKYVIDIVKGYRGATDYSYVLEKNLKHFGWISDNTVANTKPAEEKKTGFFGSLFKSKPSINFSKSDSVQQVQRRSLILHVTDGGCDDKDRTRRILAESQKRGDEVCFLFIGINNQSKQFDFLVELQKMYANVSFLHISDLKQFVKKPTDEINRLLVNDKLLAWLKK